MYNIILRVEKAFLKKDNKTQKPQKITLHKRLGGNICNTYKTERKNILCIQSH